MSKKQEGNYMKTIFFIITITVLCFAVVWEGDIGASQQLESVQTTESADREPDFAKHINSLGFIQ